MKTARHPCLDFTITFTGKPYHTYRDQNGTRYTSVSKFTRALFPPFDAPAAAARVAFRTGQTKEEVLARWKEKGRRATDDIGTPVHEYAEAVILGLPTPTPTSDLQRHAFPIVDRAVSLISKRYETLSVEQIIFDPLFDTAGTCDWLLRNRATAALAVLDWKTCETIDDNAWGRMALPPIDHVPDSKLAHYTMQLSTYGWILTDPGYSSYDIFRGQPVELALIHVPHPGMGDAPNWIPLAYWGEEVGAAMLASKPGGPKPREISELDAIPDRALPRVATKPAPKPVRPTVPFDIDAEDEENGPM